MFEAGDYADFVARGLPAGSKKATRRMPLLGPRRRKDESERLFGLQIFFFQLVHGVLSNFDESARPIPDTLQRVRAGMAFSSAKPALIQNVAATLIELLQGHCCK